MNEKEFEIVTLEDNLEYAEIYKMNHNNTTYIFLSEVNNPDNFCIRKLEIENNEEFIVGLDSKEEFNTILKLFTKKYLN